MTSGLGPAPVSRRRRRHSRGRVSRWFADDGLLPSTGAIAVAGVLLMLVGCGGPGPVHLTNVPVPTGSDRASCEALVSDLPASLGNSLDRRKLDPQEPTAAAYGKAPVLLTCGAIGRAASYRPDATLSVVDNVGWFAEELSETVRFSTPTRVPQIVLTLPADLQPFEVLVAIAPAVRSHSRSTTA